MTTSPFRLGFSASTASTATIRLGRERRGTIALVLANDGDGAIRTRFDVQPQAPAGGGWFTLDANEFTLGPRARISAPARIAVPFDVEGRAFIIRVVAVDVDAPEERVSAPLEIRLEVPASAGGGPAFHLEQWAWIAIAAALTAVLGIVLMVASGWLPGLVLLLTATAIGGLGYWVWRHDDHGEATPPAPAPSPEPPTASTIPLPLPPALPPGPPPGGTP